MIMQIFLVEIFVNVETVYPGSQPWTYGASQSSLSFSPVSSPSVCLIKTEFQNALKKVMNLKIILWWS